MLLELSTKLGSAEVETVQVVAVDGRTKLVQCIAQSN